MRERMFALFLLGAVLLVPPVLSVFNIPVRFFGVPTLYLYLFAAWVVLIGLAAFVVERVAATDELAESAAEPAVPEIVPLSGAPHDA